MRKYPIRVCALYPHLQMFYDMGAGSTTATIVEYAYVKSNKNSPKVPALKVCSLQCCCSVPTHERLLRCLPLQSYVRAMA